MIVGLVTAVSYLTVISWVSFSCHIIHPAIICPGSIVEQDEEQHEYWYDRQTSGSIPSTLPPLLYLLLPPSDLLASPGHHHHSSSHTLSSVTTHRRPSPPSLPSSVSWRGVRLINRSSSSLCQGTMSGSLGKCCRRHFKHYLPPQSQPLPSAGVSCSVSQNSVDA